METKKNLQKAFEGESQANRKYTSFSRKAEEDGYKQIAKLFRAAAEAETVHALNHLKALGEIKTTEENIKSALEGETFEYENMYPPMIEQAKEEEQPEAQKSFNYANKVEEIHSNLYKKALDSAKSGKDLEQKELYVCEICGNTVENNAPDVCPICGAKKEQFKKIE
ncbi:MAG: rubrerythrin family protein [Nanobdellota archaeon]